jgi:hypothetical protein
MTAERKELLSLFAELSELYPSMRFGQLVSNVAGWARGPVVSATYDATDEEMITAAKKNLAFRRSRREELGP